MRGRGAAAGSTYLGRAAVGSACPGRRRREGSRFAAGVVLAIRDLLLPAGVLVVSPRREPTVTAHSKSNGYYPHQIHTKLLEARAQTESVCFSAGPCSTQPK